MNLIIGASGILGSRIADKLLQDGKPVRAVSRHPDKLTSLESKGAQIVRGDLCDPSWMESALQGIQSVFLAAHGLVPPSRTNNMDTVDDAGIRHLIDAAKRAGTGRVIFTSSYFAKPDSPARFGRIKYKIEEYIKISGLEYTIVRPGAFIETHALILIAEPLRAAKPVRFLGKSDVPMTWISADDVADYMVKTSEDPEFRNTIKVIGGPDVLSRVDVLEMTERLLGKKAKRSHAPAAMLRVMKSLTGPFHPGLSYLLDMALAEENPANREERIPASLDWTAPTCVEEVLNRWMADDNVARMCP